MHSSNSPKLSIFVPHPSDRLTNCKPDGDGLVAFGFIQHLAQRGHTLHVVVNSAEIEGSLPNNIKLYPANIENVPNLFKRICYAIRVRQIFNQIQQQSPIDVIHQLNPVVAGVSLSLSGTQCPVILGPIVAPWSVKIKLPLSTTIFYWIKQMIAGILFNLQQEQASALLVATPAALVRLKNSAAINKKIHDLRHGIDASLFSPLPNCSLEKPIPRGILFLGQLNYHKGIFTLLDAFDTLVAAQPECQLILAGPWGAQIDEIKARISEMAGRSQIKLLGPIQRADVPQLINQCTVYCMPSYGEAFGMGALEAMACGKPVVGTDAGGLQYLIADEGGRKVPPGDPNVLVKALLEILNSPDLQKTMGQHNRTCVETSYSWERVVEKLEAIYYKSLGYNTFTDK
jgi:L-malate glycosyltransferase